MNKNLSKQRQQKAKQYHTAPNKTWCKKIPNSWNWIEICEKLLANGYQQITSSQKNQLKIQQQWWK